MLSFSPIFNRLVKAANIYVCIPELLALELGYCINVSNEVALACLGKWKLM